MVTVAPGAKGPNEDEAGVDGAGAEGLLDGIEGAGVDDGSGFFISGLCASWSPAWALERRLEPRETLRTPEERRMVDICSIALWPRNFPGGCGG